MEYIKTTYDLAKDLTIFTASGTLTVDYFREYLASYYDGEVTQLILWDLTKADLSTLKSTHLEELVQIIYRLSEVRRGGKTAFVHDESFVYGIGKMFQAFSMMRELSFEVLTFKSIDEAKVWLGV